MTFGRGFAAVSVMLAGAGSNFVQEGRRDYSLNKFAEAAVQFQKAIQANPLDRNARLWLGYSYLALDDLEAALRNLEPLRESRSADPEYLYAVSEAYTRGARRFSERIAGLGDGSARAHEILAYRYEAAGQPRSAVAELQRAARLRPALAGVHLETAEILWQEGRYDEAAAELRAELRIAPKDFLANLRYGQYLLRTRDYEDAIQPLTIAAGYRKYPEAYELAAYAWEKLGRSADRIAALRAGLDVFPGDANLAEMCRQYLAEHRGASARRWSPPLFQEQTPPNVGGLRAALARNPRHEDILFSLSRVYSARGQNFFERLERAEPGSYRVLQVKGLNAEYAEDFERAESYYRQVAAAQPRLAGARYSLGRALRKLGKEEEGLAEIAKELEIDPQNYLACYELGSGLLGRGDAGQAVPMLQHALALRPEFPEAKTDLAKALVQLERPGDAIPILKSVISKHPNHPTAHFLLYRAYAAMGSADLAKKELDTHRELLKMQRERNKQ